MQAAIGIGMCQTKVVLASSIARAIEEHTLVRTGRNVQGSARDQGRSLPSGFAMSGLPELTRDEDRPGEVQPPQAR